MSQYRNEPKMIDLFARIGFVFPRDVASIIFAEASGGYDMATINDFRSAAVRYTDAVTRGKEAEWRRERGL